MGFFGNPVFIALIVILVALVIGISYSIVSSTKSDSKSKKRNRAQILKEANRRLAANPKDKDALVTLADIYYTDESWEKAMKTYAVLMELCGIDSDINEFLVTSRYGIAAMKVKNYDEAYKGLLLAASQGQTNFEIDYNLGYLEYRRKNYEKASQYLKQASNQNPDHIPTWRFLGLSLFRTGKPKEALALLKRVVDMEPDDKETLFIMGECYYEIGMNDQAIRIFTHLRADPELGPQAALLAGTTHMKVRSYEAAVMDFEIGLKHRDIKPDVMMELKYRLAAAYTKMGDIEKALPMLMQIREIDPSYKDVDAQISKYRELNSNKNLQIFLLAPAGDFVTLCRKIVTNFIPQSKVKIVDISVQRSEYADILAEVETSKWMDTILFRFIRANGAVGELMLRDFHSRIKDLHAGRGYCITSGEFSESAREFVKARLVDLIEKEDLMKILNYS